MKNLQRFDVDKNGIHKEVAPATDIAKSDTTKNTNNIIPFPTGRVKGKEGENHGLR